MPWKYFLPFHTLPFHSVDCFLWCTEVLKFLCNPIMSTFAFFFLPSVSYPRNYYQIRCQSFPMFFSKSLIVWGHIFRYLIHLNYFLCTVYKGPTSFFFNMIIQYSQHHLLKRRFFPHCVVLAFLTEIIWQYSWRIISGLYFTDLCVSLCWYHIVLIIITL